MWIFSYHSVMNKHKWKLLFSIWLTCQSFTTFLTFWLDVWWLTELQSAAEAAWGAAECRCALEKRPQPFELQCNCSEDLQSGHRQKTSILYMYLHMKVINYLTEMYCLNAILHSIALPFHTEWRDWSSAHTCEGPATRLSAGRLSTG